MAGSEVLDGASAQRPTMGLRPLDMSTWLDAAPGHDQRHLKCELLADRRDEVYAALPGAQAASRQVALAVAESCGVSLPGVDEPLVEAARMVRDDICVLMRQGTRWHLVAAVVCFPSRWRLSDKIGRDVVSIHDPVPGYREGLGRPTQKVFESLRPRWRVNWTLLDDPSLFQPQPPAGLAGPPDDTWYLRVERQCLVPVDEFAAFTIRTDVTALRDMDPQRREGLLRSAAEAPADLAAYRGWLSR